MLRPAKPEAYRLFHEGILALSQVEQNGVCIDTEYLDQAIHEITERIQQAEAELKRDEIYKTWRKHYGDKTKLSGREQLGHIIFNVLGYPCKTRTATGKPKTDGAAFDHVDLPFVRLWLQVAQWRTWRSTFLLGIKRELVGNMLRSSYHLNTAETYRGCIAKGTLIEVVRDVSRYPKGVPIEDVRAGDLVYCYDDNLQLVIRRVLWAGKTGTRKVVRLHWSARGKKGHLDLTPEHKVRLKDGRYVRADQLLGDMRNKYDSKHAPKIGVLALGRIADRIWPTGSAELLDHRFVFEQVYGPLSAGEIVHHKDLNHLNNTPGNLERHTKASHARLHAPDVLTDDVRRKAVASRVRNHALYGDRYPTGPNNSRWIHLTRYGFLRILASASGRAVSVAMDFTTLKAKAELFGIDLKEVKQRYDGKGRYLSRGRVIRAAKRGRTAARSELGINFYKLKKHYQRCGLSLDRRWANQFGEFVPHNHAVTGIEVLDQRVDVYDIEVEEYHNFIANEICVHNSCSDPNFQNFPIRNPEAAAIIRRCFKARGKNRCLVEVDFSGIEVKVAASYTHCPALVRYVTDPTTDMHRDMAVELFKLKDPPKEWWKQKGPGGGHDVRHNSKNLFVFPQFYGDYYINCARNLWEAMEKHKLCAPDGRPMRKHMRRNGITELGALDPDRSPRPGTFENHIKDIEDRFWNSRFRGYRDWRRRWWAEYQESGGFITKTGFRVSGIYSKNEVLNNPIQGSAFHCLLWCLVQAVKELRRRKMKSLIIGQIHDSMLADVPVKELDEYLEIVYDLMTRKLLDHWKWIIVPMDVEAEVSPPGGSWHEKQKYDLSKFTA